METKIPYRWVTPWDRHFLRRATFFLCLISLALPLNGFCRHDSSQTELRAKELINLSVSEVIVPLLREVLPAGASQNAAPYRADQRPRRSQDAINKELKKISRALNIVMGNVLGVDIDAESNRALIEGLSRGGCTGLGTAMCAVAAHVSGVMDLSPFATGIGAFNFTVFAFGLAATPGVVASVGTEIFYDTKNYVLRRRLKRHLKRALVANGLNQGQIAYFEAILNEMALEETQGAKTPEAPSQTVFESQDCDLALQGQRVRISLTTVPSTTDTDNDDDESLVLYHTALMGSGGQ